MKKFIGSLVVAGFLVSGASFSAQAGGGCKCRDGFKPAFQYIGQKCVRNATKLNDKGLPIDKDGKEIPSAMISKLVGTTVSCGK